MLDSRMLVQMTSDIVASHASANEMSQRELLGEIDHVFRRLAVLSDEFEEQVHEAGEDERKVEVARPALPVEAAFGAEKVFCLVCGKGMKTLRRHLSSAHGLKPRQYRKTFGISAGTPLVARNYSEVRKKMAEDLHLVDRLGEARAAREAKGRRG